MREAGGKTLLKTAANLLPGRGDVASEAIGDISGTLLDNESNYIEPPVSAHITVPPQEVWLQISRSF